MFPAILPLHYSRGLLNIISASQYTSIPECNDILHGSANFRIIIFRKSKWYNLYNIDYQCQHNRARQKATKPCLFCLVGTHSIKPEEHRQCTNDNLPRKVCCVTNCIAAFPNWADNNQWHNHTRQSNQCSISQSSEVLVRSADNRKQAVLRKRYPKCFQHRQNNSRLHGRNWMVSWCTGNLWRSPALQTGN